MKATRYAFLFVLLILFTGAGFVQAQDTTVVQSWDFEDQELGDWYGITDDTQYSSTAEITDEEAYEGTYSVKLTAGDDMTNAALVNDDQPVEEGDIISFQVFVPADQLDDINGLQPFYQTNGWGWADDWYDSDDIVVDEWFTIQIQVAQEITSTERIGIQITGNDAAGTATIYVDHISITRITEPEEPVDLPHLVDQWGFMGGRVAGWGITHGDPGNITLSGDTSMTSGWSAVRGGFAPVTPDSGEAFIVSGQIHFEGQGPSHWNAMRYGIFRHDDPGVLEYADTDSARWSGSEGAAYGYLLMTMSEINERATWGIGGAGDLGAVYGGSWISTFGEGSTSLGVIDQRLFRAIAPEGLYDFAISAHTQEDGNNQLRFYFIHEDGEYWHGGIVIDTTGVPTDTYNGVNFALNADSDDMTAAHFIDITVDVGAPITLPDPPLETPPHDIGRILNENRTFGLSAPGPAGDEPFWTLGQGHNSFFEIDTEEYQSGDRSLKINFGEWGGSPNVWEIEAVSEPFYPAVGDTIRASVWMKASNDTMLARIYLGLPGGNWQRLPDFNMEVVCSLTTEWQMFSFPDYGVIQRDVDHDPDGAVRFGIEVNLPENDSGIIWIDNAIVRKVGEADPVSVRPDSEIPLVFSLDQNYPNPFNPTTQIRFTLPEQADVLLEVYDILGRRVATLIDNENFSVGQHSVTWDATSQTGRTLSSGMYIYRLQAGSYVETKRMMFLK